MKMEGFKNRACEGDLATSPGNFRHDSAGFTLVELLIAFALLAIILGALYSTFFLSHKAMEGMDDWLVKLQECRMLMDTMSREADSILFGGEVQNPVFKLEDRDAMGKQASRFTFQAFSPLMPGLSLISYHADEKDGKLVLYKEVQSAYRSGTQPEKIEMVEDLEAFSVEAMDNNQWVKTWDGAGRKAIPSELRFTITILAKDRKVTLSEIGKLKIGKSILTQ